MANLASFCPACAWTHDLAPHDLPPSPPRSRKLFLIKSFSLSLSLQASLSLMPPLSHTLALDAPVMDIVSLGLRSGFESPDLERPGRLPHKQGLREARLGYRDGSPQLGAPGPGVPPGRTGSRACTAQLLRPSMRFQSGRQGPPAGTTRALPANLHRWDRRPHSSPVFTGRGRRYRKR